MREPNCAVGTLRRRTAIEQRGGAPVLERDGDIRLVQDNVERAGFSAIYRFDCDLRGGWPGATRSEAHVSCYVGERWTVKYRISYPASSCRSGSGAFATAEAKRVGRVSTF